MNTVLIQEVIRYNTLLSIMKKHIKTLKKALSGRIVMSEEMEKISTSLYNNQVPQLWIKFGFLSLKPLMSWLTDLKERVSFFQEWIDKGTPKAFCLPSKLTFLFNQDSLFHKPSLQERCRIFLENIFLPSTCYLLNLRFLTCSIL